MKTLVLALALSFTPVAASAQIVSADDASSCTMATLYTSVLTRAKGEFEAQIKSSMVKKFGKDVKYVITEKMEITPPTDDNPFYLLSITKVRIETLRKNILTLNVPTIALYSKEAEFSIQHDDEGALRAETCSASFIGEFPANTNIINADTQIFVASVGTDSLSVSGFEAVKAK
jgi:hypothetical protein